MSFEDAYEQLMEEENVCLSNVKTDRGGETWAGITRKNFPEWKGWAFLDKTPPDYQMAKFWTKDFYKQWWDRLGLSRFRNASVSSSVFSYAVNAGNNQAVKDLQRAINHVSTEVKVHPYYLLKEDGILGGRTFDAANVIDDWLESIRLLREYAARKVLFRAKCLLHDRTQIANILGWARRDLNHV